MYQTLAPLDYFRLLVADPSSIPLLEAAASIAVDAHPDLDLPAVLHAFDRLAGKLSDDCRGVSDDRERLERLLSFFHGRQGFAGNLDAYYDPDNSYLHRVLERRRGIPITLAVLLIELARSIGLDAHGVGFPGHFLARVNLREGVALIDPFSGSRLDQERLARNAQAHGLSAESLIAPATSAQILTRMLGNLWQIHQRNGDDTLREKVAARLGILNGTN
ncbi:MAG: hypothetical protein RIS35_3065 [Pseudomonadota bacterium]